MTGRKKCLLVLACAGLLPVAGVLPLGLTAETFHIDSKTGNDANDGLSPRSAWRTLAPASRRHYTSGDRLLLRRGCTFNGTLRIVADGSAADPVVVDAYDGGDGNAALPVINAKGFLAGVQVTEIDGNAFMHAWGKADSCGAHIDFNCRNVVVQRNLITAQLPAGCAAVTKQKIMGNPRLQNAGSLNPSDYAPTNPATLRARGLRIAKLPGDSTGIAIGFEVRTDYFGNPIAPGLPDVGAIVCGGRTDHAPALGATRLVGGTHQPRH